MTGRDVPDAYRQAKIKAEDRPLLVYELNGYWFISLCLDGAVGMGMTPDAASAYVDDTISVTRQRSTWHLTQEVRDVFRL
mmetsp:Transcript_2440/g.3737  ORF Transcript_2440/g.3737 Transcript_2440/m.3737 type:complete len:80 (-) Transcript_2440:162-401(-)